MQQNTLGTEWLSPSEKDLGVVVDIIWKIIKKCAVIINRVDYILGYIRRNGAIQSRHVIIPLHLVLVGLHLEQGVAIAGPPIRKMLGTWRGFPWRATKVFWDLEHMFWDLWGENEETGLFLSSREKAKGQFNSSLQLPEGQFERRWKIRVCGWGGSD